jgi:beta-lactamase class A
MSALEDRVIQLLRRLPGSAGCAAVNLLTGERLVAGEQGSFPTMSAIKLPILVELFRQAESERLDLDALVELGAGRRVRGSGVLKELSEHARLSVRDLAVLMTIVSDNTATNLLIKLVGGPDAVNATMREFGLDQVVLVGPLSFRRLADDVGSFGRATPAHLMALAELLARERAARPETCREIVKVLRRQQDLDKAARYLDLNPYALEFGQGSRISVACKTGYYPGTHSDVGIVHFHESPAIAYCLMATECHDASLGVETEASVLFGLLMREIVVAWWPRDAGRPPVLGRPFPDLA